MHSRRLSFYKPLISGILIYVCLFTGCSESPIATTKSESEANKMFDILYSNGFSVGKKQSGDGETRYWMIYTESAWFDEDETAVAIQVLNDHGFPRNEPHLAASGESIGIVSEREQKEKQRLELQRQIEDQLYTLPDVIRVSVIIAQPENSGLSLEKNPPKASVSIVQKRSKKNKLEAAEVKKLVVGGVPDLGVENVSVMVTRHQLRGVPHEKLAFNKRNKKILVYGICIGVFLLLAVGLTWIVISKRRKEKSGSDEKDMHTDGLPGGLLQDAGNDTDKAGLSDKKEPTSESQADLG